MKNCTHCIHAEWKRTAAGKLHPSGDGQCTKKIIIPQLPASKVWSYGYGNKAPEPSWGGINRREELRDHCVYWSDKS